MFRYLHVCVCTYMHACVHVCAGGGVCALKNLCMWHVYLCPANTPTYVLSWLRSLVRVVPYHKLKLSDYYTVSLDGVTRFFDGQEAEFVELDSWVKEYQNFKWLRKMKTFSKFFIWKAFSSWRRNVKWK